MNRSIISEKIESWIEKYPNYSGQGLDNFKGEFYQTFKEESTTTLSDSWKIEDEEHFQIPLWEAVAHDANAKHWRCRTPIVSLIDWCTNPQESTRNWIQRNIKVFTYCDQVSFYNSKWFYIQKSYKCNIHINQMKKPKYLIISIQVGKESDKIQHSFLIKKTLKLGIEKTPQHDRSYIWKV